MIKSLFRSGITSVLNTQMRMKIPYKTERYFRDLTTEDLFNRKYIR
jgi:hypothetical protein